LRRAARAVLDAALLDARVELGLSAGR
jgi:hypothetical protein